MLDEAGAEGRLACARGALWSVSVSLTEQGVLLPRASCTMTNVPNLLMAAVVNVPVAHLARGDLRFDSELGVGVASPVPVTVSNGHREVCCGAHKTAFFCQRPKAVWPAWRLWQLAQGSGLRAQAQCHRVVGHGRGVGRLARSSTFSQPRWWSLADGPPSLDPAAGGQMACNR